IYALLCRAKILTRAMQQIFAKCVGLLLGFSIVLSALSMQQLQAQNAKPTIVELINLLKPGSLTHEKGKWVQTWVDAPGFDGVQPATVDIPNGFASFVDTGTGAGSISHEFAVYYPEGAGAILVHNFQDDRDAYVSEIKFYQLRATKLQPVASPLTQPVCRDLASAATIKTFYKNPLLSGLDPDPILPTFELPRKGTTILAYCSGNLNRFQVQQTMAGKLDNNLDMQEKIHQSIQFTSKIQYLWDKKKGVFRSKKVK
ncbi:MAG TPA: hypothetical protein PLY93_12530, partial [Turneriella sp.]|nr:hypothetical protein [Turneriella sp.]